MDTTQPPTMVTQELENTPTSEPVLGSTQVVAPQFAPPSRRHQLVTLLVLLVTLVLIGAALWYRTNQLAFWTQVTNTIPQLKEIIPSPSPVFSPQPTVSPTVSPTPTATPNLIGVANWEIARTDDDIVTRVASGPFSGDKPLVTIAGDWLLSPIITNTPGTNDVSVSVKAHNWRTAQTETWYETAIQSSESGFGVSDIRVINDRLFIMVGPWYSSEAKIYWSDLSTKSPFQTITTKYPGTFQVGLGGWYVQGATGDGCGGVKTFSLFNPNQPSVQLLTESNEGCAQGNRVIGLLNDGLLMGEVAVTGTFRGQYLDLQLLNAADQAKTVLLAREQMPTNVSTIALNPSRNALYMVGEQLTKYDLVSRALETLSPVPAAMTNADYLQIAVTDQVVCVYDPQSQQGYEYNLVSRTVVSSITDCQAQITAWADPQAPIKKQYESYQAYYDSLRLPEKYQLRLLPVE